MGVRRIWQRILSILLSACFVLSLVSTAAAGGMAQDDPPEAAQPAPPQPVVSDAIRQDVSPALRELGPSLLQAETEKTILPRLSLWKPESLPPGSQPQVDPVLQSQLASGAMPATQFNFEGVRNLSSVLPPDTNGDVSSSYYVQWVNLSLAIWKLDRSTQTATRVYGPTSGNAIWSGFGGACEFSNDGDPIVLYDHLADRWLLSQFAIPSFPYGPFLQCIAVSQTGDPTGAWFRYAYAWKNGARQDVMNDYPHFGVWPDGYYMTVNQFAEVSSNPRGTGAASFEREKMLLGKPARMISFDLYDTNPNFSGLLPADLDGPPPPAGTPAYFAAVDDASKIGPEDAMRIWEFYANWSDPAQSRLGLAGQPNSVLPVANFTPLCPATSNCIPQPDTLQRLDAIGDRIMHRVQYRFFGSHASLVTNHTVDAGSGRAGVRWYELRHEGSGWNIRQQGTYAGDGSNTEHRWMGSAAMDNAGNIAIGYSVSSASTYPSIRYTGRLAGDPLNILPQGEATLVAGSGSQTSGHARWGDYSMLSVDPSDDCTFWFTSEYYQSTSDREWRTRIGSFTFPSCLSNAKGYLRGTVIEKDTGAPLENARVEAGGFSTLTDANGFYQIYNLPTGTYTVTASLYGYMPKTASQVEVVAGPATQQDFVLAPVEKTNVSGVVLDGSGQGWPLYARIDITAAGFASSVFTDPADGSYRVQLVPGMDHTFTVNAVSPGYQETTRTVILPAEGGAENFSLAVDPVNCTAPGYDPLNGCTPRAGGLINGFVLDANTGAGVNEAVITSQDAAEETAVSMPTLEDPGVEDGFYILFSSQVGGHAFTAAHSGYAADTQTVQVVDGQVSSTDFHLPAGKLRAGPQRLSVNVYGTQPVTQVVTLDNRGTLPASFSLSEVNAPIGEVQPSGPFAVPTRHVSPKRIADLNAAAYGDYSPPSAERLQAGRVIQNWPSGLAHPWGIGVHPASGDIWLGNVAAGGGDDLLYRFSLSGAAAGEKIPVGALDTYFAADLAFNPFTQTFWQVGVGGSNCLVELDPALQAPTGGRICPPFDNSQRGLAFNPLDGTYYSGSWTDGILYHFVGSGTILDSYDTGLNISGLAFNPASGHLFLLVNAARGFDVYALDVRNRYALLGGFDIEGLGDFEQAGMEIDCSGHLWVSNQASGAVLEIDSGEASTCAWSDIPWLSVTPVAGSLQPGEELALVFTFDPQAASRGSNAAQVIVSNDTPYGSLTIPVTLNLDAYGVTLTPDPPSQSGEPGARVTHHLEIHNWGKSVDSFDVSISGNQWNVALPETVISVGPESSATLAVMVDIPENATPGARDVFDVRVTSRGDPSMSASVRVTTISVYKLFFPWVDYQRNP